MKTEDIYKLVEDMRKELMIECNKIEDKADRIFVKMETFEPVRKIVFGFVGIVLFAVISLLLSLVVRTK